MFNNNDRIQFRKEGGWDNAVSDWCNGFFEKESQKCYFIRDASGKVNEYWKHRIEIRIYDISGGVVNHGNSNVNHQHCSIGH